MHLPTVTDWKPETFITIAANSIQELRKCDVYRLIDSCPAWAVNTLIKFIREHRPEFSAEIHDCMVDLNLM